MLTHRGALVALSTYLSRQEELIGDVLNVVPNDNEVYPRFIDLDGFFSVFRPFGRL